MKKKMLIDATQAEETRVAVMNGNRLEEFDYESALRKPIKGNFYLAKITRVEPSLQAAFVNYGGNRHGFLPFSEIHPDYFRIPIADREALLEEREAMIAEYESKNGDVEDDIVDEDPSDEDEDDHTDDAEDSVEDDADHDDDESDHDEQDDAEADEGNEKSSKGRRRRRSQHSSKKTQKKSRDDDWDPEERFRYTLRKRYKIQEVIKRGQIVLVQATKEERGNKGAAFTSYLSIPGRYCVLMPNSPRGGGVSRKIANYQDRNRMRDRLKKMEVPKGMSVILRTAGVERTQAEVNRDLDYLLKVWGTIREQTLQSSAPALIYEEANLIKRIFRDVYSGDVDEIIVAGAEGYKTAKDFMKIMLPSHAKKIKEHKNKDLPLFAEYKAERQIADIGDVQVTLPSGGYLIINPTEALVSIDVNSGRATKERHIEETALKTNLEAAVEVARQLRLRDLGGLVVIDFIDMDNRRNNAKVERKMREALSTDRARVQNSRISSFGLMALSRQRLSASLTEAQYETCDHCSGLGRVRSADATSIMALRAVEDEGLKKTASVIALRVRNAVALYILNNKRKQLGVLEERYDFAVQIIVDEDIPPSSFRVDVVEKRQKPDTTDANDADDQDDQTQQTQETASDEKPEPKKRSRGGRGRRRNQKDNTDTNADSDTSSPQKNDAPETSKKEEKSEDNQDKKSAPKRRRRSSKAKTDDVKESKDTPKEEPKAKDDKKADEPNAKDADKPAKKRGRPKKVDASNDDAPKADDQKSKPAKKDEPTEASKFEVINEPPKKKKKGWWSN